MAGPVGFFHLCLADEAERVNLLISDRSGEAFDAARTNTAFIDRLNELPLADRVCFLLDAGKLTNVETRAGYRRTFKQAIRSLLHNNAIPSKAAVEVLVTKIDKLTVNGGDVEKLAALDAYEAELISEFRNKIEFFSCHRVCALPRSNTSMGLSGIEEMVTQWCQPDMCVDVLPLPIHDAERQIDRLFMKWVKE